jgi:hypothetical protein
MYGWFGADYTVNLGLVDHRQCEYCKSIQPFHLFLRYHTAGLWGLFNYVEDQKYFMVCMTCRGAHEAVKSGVEKQFERHPIPFMRRHGFYLLAATLGLALFLYFVVFHGS